MRHLIVAIVCFLFTINVFGIQLKNKPWEGLSREKLEEQLSKEKDPKNRIDLMNLLAYKLSAYDHLWAEKYAKEAQADSEKSNYFLGKIDSINNLGLIYIREGNLEDARKFYEKVEKIKDDEKYKPEIISNNPEFKIALADSYNGLGRYYQMKGKFHVAITKLMESESILKNTQENKILDNRALANCYHVIAVLYFYDTNASNKELKYSDDSPELKKLKYFTESLKLRKKVGDIDDIALSYYSIGELYQNKGDYKNAEINLKLSENTVDTKKNLYIHANILQCRGDIARKNNDPSGAEKYFKECEKLFIEIGDKFQIAAIRRDIGILYNQIKNYSEAIYYLNSALEIADKIENPKIISVAAEELALVYKITGNIQKSEKLRKEAANANELLKENTMVLFHMASINNRILIIEAEKLETERIHLRSERRYLRSERIYLRSERIYLIIAIVLIILAAIVLAKLYFEKKKSYKHIELLSKIGKEIVASLSVEEIIVHGVYENVNKIMDAQTFAIGLFNEETNNLDFTLIEKGNKLPPGSFSLTEEDRLSVICYNRQKAIAVDNYPEEYKKYSTVLPEQTIGARFPSILYLPLTLKLEGRDESRIGVITIQSPKIKAYKDYHLMMFKNIATYAAIALNNANAVKKLRKQDKEIEEKTFELIASQKELKKEKELSTLKDQFVYTLSHQYKTPLSTIDLTGQYLSDYLYSLSQEEIQERLGRINGNVNRMKALMENLLLQGKKFAPGFRDLNNLCSEIIEEIKVGKGNSHRITYQSNAEIGEAWIDSEFLKIILDNLITNSINYSKAGSEIIIKLGTSDNNALISVKDYGAGMPEDIIHMKDRRFHRGSNVIKDTQGTGLGLSIVEHYVEQHGGKVRYESKLNEGTTVYVSIPLKNKKV